MGIFTHAQYVNLIPMSLLPFPLAGRKLFPFPWDFHENPIPIRIFIPVYTSIPKLSRGGNRACEFQSSVTTIFRNCCCL